MKIVSNEKKISRSIRIGFFATLSGAMLLLASMFLVFQETIQFGLYALLLLGAFILVQVGNYYSTFGRRPDQILNQALKKLDKNFTLYHYMTPVPHLLVGPTGVWILHPRFTKGIISYDEKRKRWRRRGGGAVAFLRNMLTRDGLGRPDLEIAGQGEALDRYLQKHWDAEEGFSIQAALVFLDEGTEVAVQDAHIPSTHIRDLKKVVLKPEAEAKLVKEQIKQVNALFAAA